MIGIGMHRTASLGWLPIAGVLLVCPAWAQDAAPPAGEAQAIDEVRARALAAIKKRYPESEQTLVRRDAHAKAHGCVKASFEVDPALAPELRVGTFSQPGQRFKALIRFSNGAFEPGPDTGSDGRGMAIKIIDAEPQEKSAPRQRRPHDILMINFPAFFSPDVADYKDFAQSGALTGAGDGLRRYFVPGFNPLNWRVRQGYIAYSIASQKISSPLAVRYFSMAPFGFGSGRAAKYSARPCAGSAATDTAASAGPNFLGDTLRARLSSGSACFELLVQERKPGMPLDDATVEWSETASPFRHVGKVEIPAQKIDAPGRAQTCESLTFNPWNAPDEQRPLGGINRVRKAVYDEISRYRTQRNNVSPADPASVWDDF